jgi:hypothetical protein
MIEILKIRKTTPVKLATKYYNTRSKLNPSGELLL